MIFNFLGNYKKYYCHEIESSHILKDFAVRMIIYVPYILWINVVFLNYIN